MGDDWPDLSAFAIAGMSVTVPNGHEVRRRADFGNTGDGWPELCVKFVICC